jgi:hypothetical protein
LGLEVLLEQLEDDSQECRLVFLLVKVPHRNIEDDRKEGLVGPSVFEHVGIGLEGTAGRVEYHVLIQYLPKLQLEQF